jgi:hypothetical protein
MADVRERVGSRLANLEQPPLAHAAPPDFSRQVSRIREMVQDATRKTERLSTAGERASRAADRLMRRLDESVRDVEGMVVRLSPPGVADVGPTAPPARRFTVIDPTAGQDENDNDAKERW